MVAVASQCVRFGDITAAPDEAEAQRVSVGEIRLADPRVGRCSVGFC
jgi:hypothetical protein